MDCQGCGARGVARTFTGKDHGPTVRACSAACAKRAALIGYDAEQWTAAVQAFQRPSRFQPSSQATVTGIDTPSTAFYRTIAVEMVEKHMLTVSQIGLDSARRRHFTEEGESAVVNAIKPLMPSGSVYASLSNTLGKLPENNRPALAAVQQEVEISANGERALETLFDALNQLRTLIMSQKPSFAALRKVGYAAYNFNSLATLLPKGNLGAFQYAGESRRKLPETDKWLDPREEGWLVLPYIRKGTAPPAPTGGPQPVVRDAPRDGPDTTFWPPTSAAEPPTPAASRTWSGDETLRSGHTNTMPAPSRTWSFGDGTQQPGPTPAPFPTYRSLSNLTRSVDGTTMTYPRPM